MSDQEQVTSPVTIQMTQILDEILTVKDDLKSLREKKKDLEEQLKLHMKSANVTAFYYKGVDIEVEATSKLTIKAKKN